jgi:Domain of unknown function (DUF3943)
MDTLRSFVIRKNNPYLYTFPLHHKESGVGIKILRASAYSVGYNLTMGAYLLAAPYEVSKWDKHKKFDMQAVLKQYDHSYSSPAVIDHDMDIINYVGHPYQGGYYFNTMRCQGATFWQSAMFCLGNSILWEYGWEGGMEQPSIQDLLTTPIAGVVVGELAHVATIKMSKNGFKWYEVIIVCLINPAYAMNNGFRTHHVPHLD